MPLYVDLDLVEVVFQGEAINNGAALSAERRYIIKVGKNAFTGTTQSGRRYLLVADSNASMSPTEMFYLSALAKSVHLSLSGVNDIFRVIPFNMFYYYGIITSGIPIIPNFNIAYHYLGFNGHVFSPQSPHLICSSSDIRFADGAAVLTLGYSFYGFRPSNKLYTFIMPSGNAQRYPSVYRFKSDGTVELNTVGYNGDTQVGELPETYGSECRFRVTVLNPIIPSYYQGFVGTVNNAPINWLSTAIVGEPADYPYSLMIDGYNVSCSYVVTPRLTGAWPPSNVSVLYPQLLNIHELSIVGYDNKSVSADAGFVRPVVYVDPATGRPPEDITTNNGIAYALIARPADWGYLAQ